MISRTAVNTVGRLLRSSSATSPDGSGIWAVTSPRARPVSRPAPAGAPPPPLALPLPPPQPPPPRRVGFWGAARVGLPRRAPRCSPALGPGPGTQEAPAATGRSLLAVLIRSVRANQTPPQGRRHH